MGCAAIIVLNTQSAPLLATYIATLYNRFLEEPSEISPHVPVWWLGSRLKRAESSFCAAHSCNLFDLKWKLESSC